MIESIVWGRDNLLPLNASLSLLLLTRLLLLVVAAPVVSVLDGGVGVLVSWCPAWFLLLNLMLLPAVAAGSLPAAAAAAEQAAAASAVAIAVCR